MSVAIEVGDRIRRAREAAGWTQAQLGGAVGFAPQTVASWESGRREPGLGALVRLSSMLGVSVAELFPALEGEIAEPVQAERLAGQLKRLRQEVYVMRDQLVADGILPAP